MLSKRVQRLKNFVLVFMAFVMVGLMAPAAFALDASTASSAGPVTLLNEFFLNGKRMIMEIRIYEAPASAQNVEPAENIGTVQNVGSTLMIMPTRGKVIQYYRTGHFATYITYPTKPPILAAAAGTVIKASSGTFGGGYGDYVIIDHGNGLSTLYAHMDGITVKAGDQVKQGQVIGKMGNTGRVYGKTGIQLHFEVRLNGRKMPPMAYIN